MESEVPKETPLKKIYFNIYVAGVIRQRHDFEAINCDLLYFTLLMKMNQYAKEVYFVRKAKTGETDAKLIFNHLSILRKFVLDFYEIKPPNWKLIQNELEDSLEVLDSLPVEEDPFGDKKTLDSLASKVDDLSLDDMESSPEPLTRTPSVLPGQQDL
jgi:hypothetical protein